MVLNDEGVPAPGAAWKRTVRRTDGKRLASAIHGHTDRGTGILNNRRYVGVVTGAVRSAPAPPATAQSIA